LEQRSRIDVDGWLSCKGDFELAIAFSRMFWPEFTEHDGCVLFAGFGPTVYQEWLESCEGDRAAVEAVMNHRHLLDLFLSCCGFGHAGAVDLPRPSAEGHLHGKAPISIPVTGLYRGI